MVAWQNKCWKVFLIFCEHFASMFKVLTQGGNFSSRLVDPSQNNVKARSAWDEVDTRKFTIPARSPNLDPIKNIFHIVKHRLCQDALEQQITQEDFAAFSAKVKTVLHYAIC